MTSLTLTLHVHLHSPVAASHEQQLELGRKSHQQDRSQVALPIQVTSRAYHTGRRSQPLQGREATQQAGRRRVGKPKGQVLCYKTPYGVTVKGFFLLETQELHCIVLKYYTLVHVNTDTCYNPFVWMMCFTA